MGKLVTQAEAARMRGVTVSAISYLVRMGRIRSVEKYGRVLVYDDEVKDYKPKPAGRPATKKGKGKGK